MKLEKSELLDKVRRVFGDNTDDAYIELLEDITDSIEDTSETATKVEELTQQLEDLKAKYVARFFTPLEDEEQGDEGEEVEDAEATEIADLFEEDEENKEAE